MPGQYTNLQFDPSGTYLIAKGQGTGGADAYITGQFGAPGSSGGTYTANYNYAPYTDLSKPATGVDPFGLQSITGSQLDFAGSGIGPGRIPNMDGDATFFVSNVAPTVRYNQPTKDEGLLAGMQGLLVPLIGVGAGAAAGALGAGAGAAGTGMAEEAAALTGSLGAGGGGGLTGVAGATGAVDPFAGGFTGDIATDAAAGGAGSTAASAAAGATPSGLDMSRITDPSYWNELGGNTGLADAGASGVPGSTATYGNSGSLSKILQMPNGSSLLSKLFGGNATSDDYLKIAGALGSTALGVLGSNNQANALRDIAKGTAAERAPFLNAATGWLADPNSYFAGPGKAVMDSTLRALSTKGNPIGSGTALALADQAGLQDWRNAVTGLGNIGLAGQDLRAQLQTSAASADANVLNAIGYGINSVTNPTPSLIDTLRQLKQIGLV